MMQKRTFKRASLHLPQKTFETSSKYIFRPSQPPFPPHPTAYVRSFMCWDFFPIQVHGLLIFFTLSRELALRLGNISNVIKGLSLVFISPCLKSGDFFCKLLRGLLRWRFSELCGYALIHGFIQNADGALWANVIGTKHLVDNFVVETEVAIGLLEVPLVFIADTCQQMRKVLWNDVTLLK